MKNFRNYVALGALMAVLALGIGHADAQPPARFEVTVQYDLVTNTTLLGDLSADDPFDIRVEGETVVLSGCIVEQTKDVCFGPIVASEVAQFGSPLFGVEVLDGRASGRVSVGIAGVQTTATNYNEASIRFEESAITITGFGLLSGRGLCAPECSIPGAVMTTVRIVDLIPDVG